MKIAVIAANGRSGKAFVTKALDEGHEVYAGVHGENTLPAHHNLTIVPCDAARYDDILRLVQGKDAVVSLIGHVKGSSNTIHSQAIVHAVQAMKQSGIRRVVSLTGVGVHFPGDKVSLIDRIVVGTIKIIDNARVKDGIVHAEILKKSELDWTLIRVSKLQNIPAQKYTLKANGPAMPIVSRDTVATAILDVLRDGSFFGQAPMIGTFERSEPPV